VRFAAGAELGFDVCPSGTQLARHGEGVRLRNAILRSVGLALAAMLIPWPTPRAHAGESQPSTHVTLFASIDEVSLGRMRALRAWRVITALELDEPSSARVLPVFARYDEPELALIAEGRGITCELRTLTAAVRPDDTRITRALDQLVVTRRRRHVLQDERLTELRAVLSPVQQARFLLLLPRLQRELAQWVRQAIGDGARWCDHAPRDEAVGRSTSAQTARRGPP